MLDFARRLEDNGAPKAKAWDAAVKVGRLMATRVVTADLCNPVRCTACPICDEEPEALQHAGSGNPSARIVLVGQGAGEHEGKYALPFVGIAGTFLTMALEEAGIPRETVWLTNTIRCRPKDNRSPVPAETVICMERYLYPEIDIIKPAVIVALGLSALSSLVSPLPSSRMSDLRGQTFVATIRGHDYMVMATYHPAYAVRKHGSGFQSVCAAVVSDLARARDLARAGGE